MRANHVWLACAAIAVALSGCAAESGNAGSGAAGGVSGAGAIGGVGASGGVGGSGGVGPTGGVGGVGAIGGVGGVGGVAATGGVGGSGAIGGNAGAGGTETCAEAEVRPTRIIPTVVFLIDGSTSMTTAYSDGLNRWHALREAMLDPTDGVVRRLDGIVDFGMVIYNDEEAAQGATQTCPTLIEVEVATANGANIEAAFPATPPGFNTPTGAALDQLVRTLPTASEVTAQGLGPQIVILATDGVPYECVDWVTLDAPAVDEQAVIDAATLGTSRGVSTYVISLAEAMGTFADHLNAVAQAGGSQVAFTPANRADLVSRIETIVSSAVACEVTLAGEVDPGMECMGDVTLNGTPLTCNGADGWRLVDVSHIELTGQACGDFQTATNAELVATFPCGVYRPD